VVPTRYHPYESNVEEKNCKLLLLLKELLSFANFITTIQIVGM